MLQPCRAFHCIMCYAPNVCRDGYARHISSEESTTFNSYNSVWQDDFRWFRFEECRVSYLSNRGASKFWWHDKLTFWLVLYRGSESFVHHANHGLTIFDLVGICHSINSFGAKTILDLFVSGERMTGWDFLRFFWPLLSDGLRLLFSDVLPRSVASCRIGIVRFFFVMFFSLEIGFCYFLDVYICFRYHTIRNRVAWIAKNTCGNCFTTHLACSSTRYALFFYRSFTPAFEATAIAVAFMTWLCCVVSVKCHLNKLPRAFARGTLPIAIASIATTLFYPRSGALFAITLQLILKSRCVLQLALDILLVNVVLVTRN